MKVVHISFSDSGGAGLAAFRLHRSLLAAGVDSKMLVADKKSDDPNVIRVEKSKDLNVYHLPANIVLRKVKNRLHRKGFFLTEKERDDAFVKAIPASHRTFFTTPVSFYDLRHHPVIEAADIIHLHWIEGFVDYRTFFPSVNKPMVWTFHDENIGFGGFHYKRERNKYYPYYRELEDKYVGIKKQVLAGVPDLTMISLSEEMDQFCHKESFLRDRKSVIIPNSVDYSRFIMLDRALAKSVLKIPADSTVMVFCAYQIDEPRKGLSELLDALEELDIPNLVLICIGGGKVPRNTSVKIYRAGYVTNEDILGLYYAAADLFVMPSYQEAFAQTPLEAMSCGVPVVAFPVSGTSCLINDLNGVRCDEFTVRSLIEGIRKAIHSDFDRQAIRKDVIERFSPSVIAGEFLNVYHEVIRHNNQ